MQTGTGAHPMVPLVVEQERGEVEAPAGAQETLLSFGMWHLPWECLTLALMPLRAFGA